MILDINGRGIFPGDLLRSLHFKLGRTTRYLYHVVVKEGDWLSCVPVDWLNPETKREGGKFRLVADMPQRYQLEIIHSDYGGEGGCWYDRQRIKLKS